MEGERAGADEEGGCGVDGGAVDEEFGGEEGGGEDAGGWREVDGFDVGAFGDHGDDDVLVVKEMSTR